MTTGGSLGALPGATEARGNIAGQRLSACFSIDQPEQCAVAWGKDLVPGHRTLGGRIIGSELARTGVELGAPPNARPARIEQRSGGLGTEFPTNLRDGDYVVGARD